LNISGIGPDGGFVHKNEPVVKKENMAQAKADEVKDQVKLTGKEAEWNPKIIVGAPTGRLKPIIIPPNVHPSPIAVEIDRGIGIGIDGESIIVAPYPRNETIVVDGQLPDQEPQKLYPQRKYDVARKGNETVVDGFYNWQDYKLEKDGNVTRITGETDRESITVVDKGDQVTVDGKWPVQKYSITNKGKETQVDGFDELYDAKITREGNTVAIDGNIPERKFTITKEGNKYKVNGHYAFQDFEITVEGDKMVVQGFYPHQKFTLDRKAT